MSAPPANIALSHDAQGIAAGDALVDDHRWVMMPWRYNDLQFSGAFGAAVEQFSSPATNADGSKTGINMYLPADATLQTYAIVKFPFVGTSLALRISQYNGAGAGDLPVGCSIDGQAFEIWDPPHVRLRTQDAYSYDYAAEGFAEVTRSLPPGPHMCELTFPGDISVIRRWQMHGYAIEKRAFERGLPSGADFANMSPILLPDTAAHAISMALQTGYAIKALYFFNNDSGSKTYSIYRNAADAAASPPTPFKVTTVAAGQTAEFVLPGPSYAPLYVQASSATGAYYFVLGDCG